MQISSRLLYCNEQFQAKEDEIYKAKLEQLIEENVNKVFHPNHHLIGSLHEKLATYHMKRRRKLFQVIKSIHAWANLQFC